MILKESQIRIMAHLVFWFSYAVVTIYAFAEVYQMKHVLLRTIIIGSFHSIIVYINWLYLLPRWLDKRKFVYYTLGLSTVIWGLMPIKSWVIFTVFGSVFSQYSEIKNHYFLNHTVSTLVLVFVSTAVWYAEKGLKHQKEQREMENFKLRAELDLLRQQINPHFLFNTLNNIYSLAYMESPKTPDAILKLSVLLRYILYENKEDLIALSKELEVLKNYLELQKLRLENENAMQISISGNLETARVPPMLLLTFFENCMKHGNVEEKNGYLFCDIKVNENGLWFELENSLPIKPRHKEEGGMGLENVKRRLYLLYPNRHTLEISKTPLNFNLKLELKWH